MIAATNRVDILDPALLRSGRLDRKIEFPMPNEEARARIMQIHSRKMNVSPDVNYEELARCTDDFNGAQCKAVCVEAGMIALRRGATELNHEDYMEGILEVQAKKKANLQYYAWGHPMCLHECRNSRFVSVNDQNRFVLHSVLLSDGVWLPLFDMLIIKKK